MAKAIYVDVTGLRVFPPKKGATTHPNCEPGGIYGPDSEVVVSMPSKAKYRHAAPLKRGAARNSDNSGSNTLKGVAHPIGLSGRSLALRKG